MKAICRRMLHHFGHPIDQFHQSALTEQFTRQPELPQRASTRHLPRIEKVPAFVSCLIERRNPRMIQRRLRPFPRLKPRHLLWDLGGFWLQKHQPHHPLHPLLQGVIGF